MDKFIAHILVVDDDDGIRSLVKKYLNENNFLVTTSSDAENASEKIKVIEFDLIVLDIMMPGKNGLEFIQENKKKINTPILLLTAKGEANERVEGLETGADDYLAKPFEPKELLLRIKNILNKTIKNDQKRIIPCSVYLEGEYGQKDICIGVPVIVGRSGWDSILELDLNSHEKDLFTKSASAVRNMNNTLESI